MHAFRTGMEFDVYRSWRLDRGRDIDIRVRWRSSAPLLLVILLAELALLSERWQDEFSLIR